MSRVSGFGLVPGLAVLRIAVISFLITGGILPAAQANPRYAAIVVDVKSGKTLFSRHADSLRYPASLTKMMTLYVLFEEMEQGRFTTNSRFHVSKYASERPPSKLGLKAGQTISVETAIRALAVKSANDVATVVAEAIEGTESAFASRMTATARELGMKRTVFRNASGLPDAKQKTTAREMALLGRALQDRFPQYYEYFSTRSFTYGKRTYRNTNRLLGNVGGVDGIKTGYTRASGFNLVTSVNRDGRHIVAVVMGGKTGNSRNAHMRTLIDRHLKSARRGTRTAPLVAERQPPPLPRGRPIDPLPDYNGAFVVASAVHKPALPEPAVAEPAMADSVAPDPAEPDFQKRIGQPIDLIAQQIEQSASQPSLAYFKTSSGSPDPIEKIIAPSNSASSKMIEPAQKNTLNQMEPAQPALKAQASQKSGDWQVQIAAAPTLEGATRLLNEAQAKAGTVLKSASPVTQPVNKSGETLYRARFAGFSGKSEARAVCARLKKKSINCLAVPN